MVRGLLVAHDGAFVAGAPVIYGDAFLNDQSRLMGKVIVERGATLNMHDKASMSGKGRVLGTVFLGGRSVVGDSAVLNDCTIINSTVEGDALVANVTLRGGHYQGRPRIIASCDFHHQKLDGVETTVHIDVEVGVRLTVGGLSDNWRRVLRHLPRKLSFIHPTLSGRCIRMERRLDERLLPQWEELGKPLGFHEQPLVERVV